MMRFTWTIAAILACASLAGATTFGTDLLNGSGDFDDAGDQDDWTLAVSDSRMDSTFDTGYSASASYAWKGNANAGGDDHENAYLITDVPLVGGREVEVSWKSMKNTTSGYPSYKIRWNSGSYEDITMSSTYTFYDFTNTYSMAGSGATSAELRFSFKGSKYTSSTFYAMYVDDVIVRREVVAPVVSSLSQSLFGANTSASLDVLNVGGMAGSEKIAFDPDAAVTWVSGAAVDIDSVSWTSDGQLVLDITTHEAGMATLQVSNPYGGLSDTFDITVTPEPATLSVLLGGGVLFVVRRRKR